MALTRAELMKKLARNPKFKEAEKSGNAYVIPAAKPAEPAQDCQQLPQNQLKRPDRNNAPAGSAGAGLGGLYSSVDAPPSAIGFCIAVNIDRHAGGQEMLLCRQFLPEPSANKSGDDVDRLRMRLPP